MFLQANRVLVSFLVAITLLSNSIAKIAANTTEQSSETLTIYNGTSATLQAAIVRLNGSGTIVVKGIISIDESIGTPLAITLDIKKGARFNLRGTAILEIGGPLKAGLYAIFNSPVVFLEKSVSIVKSEWFTNVFGNDDLAINYALLSAGTIPVKLTNDVRVDSVILMNSDQTLVFENATIYPSSPMKGGAVIRNRNDKDSNITIVGGLIDGTNVSNTAYDAILLTGVDNALIRDVVAKDVHITASKDSGNFHLIDCTNSILQNVQAHGTWKMGIKVDGGSYNTIRGGYFTGTHDSGIGAIDSPNMHVKGVYVDGCGTSDASNITMNLQEGIFENSISINASGKTNGNGLTIGHEGYPAFNVIIRNNLFINNATKGVWSQGSTNTDISILNNIIMANGTGSKHPNSAGVTVYFGALRTLIQGNEILGNIRGVNLTNTSSTTSIIDNRITNSDLYGIDNDGISSTINSNYLSNRKNIFNDTKFTNLTDTKNIKVDLNLVDYNSLKRVKWLTDLQKEVLNRFVNQL